MGNGSFDLSVEGLFSVRGLGITALGLRIKV